MLNVNTIPARNLQKSYKSIIQDVKTKKRAVILTTHDKPQAVLVSLEHLEELRRLKSKQASLELLKIAIDNKPALKTLPSDLRDKANSILYTK